MRLYGATGAGQQRAWLKKMKSNEPDPAETLAIQIRAVRLPAPQREYKFHPSRNWRMDFAWPHCKIAVEVEGGTYVKGRHVRPEGYRKDCIKYNEAALLGWTVLRGDTKMVKDLDLLKTIEKAFTLLKGEENSER